MLDARDVLNAAVWRSAGWTLHALGRPQPVKDSGRNACVSS
jgi:hypothetical protein